MNKMKTILYTLSGILLSQAALQADDWPGWFGPQRDGVWREKGIVQSFPEKGPEILWRTKINRGYAGPAVAGGRVFIMDRKVADPAANPNNPFARGQIPGNERLVCIDAESGKVIWEKGYDCPYSVSYAAGPRATPLIEEDRVYTLGAEGNLICRKVNDGAQIWAKDFNQITDAKTPTWGFSATPMIHGNLLICLAAGNGSVALALDKMTGKEKWRALSAKEPGYAPPVVVNHGGKQLLIIWHPEAANALDPMTGKVIWTVPWKLRFGLSVSTPQLVGDILYFSSFYNGSMALGL